jgi:hypothetical protein
MTDDAWSLTTLKPHLMEELVNLWVRSWQHTLPHIDFEARRDWFNEHMRELRINGAQTFCAIAHTNHQLIGFVTVNGDTHYLDQLAITPDRSVPLWRKTCWLRRSSNRRSCSNCTSIKTITAPCASTNAKDLRVAQKASMRVRG